MSFSLLVKEEIASTPIDKDCCAMAELAAFVRCNGSMELGLGGIKIRFDLERRDTCNRICAIIKRLYKVDLDIIQRHEKRFGRDATYAIRVEDSNLSKKLLKDTGVLLFGEDGYDIESKLPKDLLKYTCCQKAYLKGAFQGSGSISNPKKEYRLEFASRDEETDIHIRMILRSKDILFHKSVRRDWCIIYISDAENIIKVLALMGAHTNLLDMENVMVVKDIRNNINRKVNFETANLNKASVAAKKQIDAIKILIENDIFDTLPIKLKEAAQMRLDNKEATLDDLAEILDISKSGANHRMRKLVSIAEEIK